MSAESTVPAALAPKRSLGPITAALQWKLTARGMLVTYVLLSFISFNIDNVLDPRALSYAYVYPIHHGLAIKIAQNITQLALILVLLPLAVVLRFRRDALVAVLIACVFISLQLFAVSTNTSWNRNYATPLWFCLFLLVGPVAMSLMRRTDLADIQRLVRTTSTALLVFFCVECATRIVLSPILLDRMDLASWGFVTLGGGWFYRYKVSLFFLDANVAGLALLCLAALLLGFRKYVHRWQIVLAYVLIGATFSRASIFAAVCQLIIYGFWKHRRFIIGSLAFAGGLALSGLMVVTLRSGIEIVQSFDPSFASKFLILMETWQWYAASSWLHRLVGVGAGNASGVIGIAAHDIFATGVLEYGIVGSLLIAAYLWLFCRRSSRAASLLVVPVIINGFSLFSSAMPFFYVVLGILAANGDGQCW
ncbi:MAG: hypothetical protein ACRD4X_12640 [Candidatus Acidiferrales bacterium]